jgi:hypothetical protein
MTNVLIYVDLGWIIRTKQSATPLRHMAEHTLAVPFMVDASVVESLSNYLRLV